MEQLEPPGQGRTRRIPDRGCIVDISYGNNTTWAANPAHFAKGSNGVAKVLQQLVSVNYVERRVRKFQVVNIPDRDAEIAEIPFGGQLLCCRNCRRRRIDADNPTVGQPLGEIDGDSPGADAYIEQSVPRLQPGQ